ncbi:ead/Ea22-like family protein [Cronobacter sakazakii]|nr:ead/Ea22-like family protein [Cronobacter sakazakii]ELY4375428.1 ead/Ea22-like family protein [Cronobacter sakazakii]ELY4420440.1 ead/Ea22-like family protein [Cronobacter sakazakii]
MNTAKLKAAALAATPGKWWIDSHGSAMVSFAGNGMKTIFVTDGQAMGKAVRHQDTGNLSHWRNDNDATFIATANPAAVLELIAALEASHKRNAELEQALSAAQNDEIDARCHVAELEKRVGELEREREAMEAVTLAMRDEMRMAGINLETGGE